nr:hypothetical protein [Tanacetum cinerariifolium]
MDNITHYATTIPKITSSFTIPTPPPPPFFNPLSQQETPTSTPTASETTTSLPVLLDFAYVFKFHERVTNLEKDLSEIKQVDQYAQALSSIPAIVDRYMDKKLGEAINKAIQAYNFDCRKEAQAEKMKSSYEAVATLFEFELTKILINKMEKNKSFDIADYKRVLYDALVKSYNIDKDIFESYGEVFSLKRTRDDNDKDQDPFARSDRGTKRRKSSKEAEPSRDSSKSAHTEEPSHVEDLGMQQDLEFVTGNNDEQPADMEVTKADWFKKLEQPPTPYPDWSKRQHVDFRPPQTWICQVARTEEPPTSFDELNDTSFGFSAFVLNRLKILNLTQEILVGQAFNLLKGTCKSITALEYHFEECSKATTERIDWHNPENKPYPFDLRNLLPLIQDYRGRKIIPQDYFINNDLKYLKGGDLSRRYSTFATKTKPTTYDLK